VAKEFSYTTTRQAGDRWVLVGDACGFIDPVYSTGVLLALRSGELAADCIVEGLARDDLSAAQLGAWVPPYEEAVGRFRRLVGAFYTHQFSFAQFLKEHPDYQGSLTDLLIGRAFDPAMESLVQDLDTAVSMAAAAS
jgi:flavin-dependent dehydrogenase